MTTKAERTKLLTFSQIADQAKDQHERLKYELKLLDGLMSNAIQNKDYKAAMTIFDKAHTLLSRLS